MSKELVRETTIVSCMLGSASACKVEHTRDTLPRPHQIPPIFVEWGVAGKMWEPPGPSSEW